MKINERLVILFGCNIGKWIELFYDNITLRLLFLNIWLNI